MLVRYLRRMGKWFTRRTPSTIRRPVRFLPRLEGLEDRTVPTTITWTNGAGDGLWRTPANWTGSVAPGPADDAVIDNSTATVTVTVAAGSPVSVKSLMSSKDFVIAANVSFTLTAGASSVSGAFTVGPNATFAETGATTTFSASGTTTVDGANLMTSAGASMSLLGATSYDASGVVGHNPLLQADGLNSKIDLSNVTTWKGAGSSTSGQRIDVQAYSGGTVMLSNVATISVGNSYFQAQDGGQIQLTALTSFTGALAGGASNLDARRGGAAITAPALTSLTNVDLNLGGGASLPVGALTTLAHANVDAFWQSGVAGVLTLPVTAIDESGFDGNLHFQANGGGSRLDLSAVTSWKAPDSVSQAFRFGVSAQNGATVDLSHVAQISVGSTVFGALDGGQINLAALTSFTGPRPGGYCTLQAAAGGAAITAPALTTLINVDLGLSGNASLPVGALTTLTHATVGVQRFLNFPAVLTLPVTAIDESGYTGTFDFGFEAMGTGSRIDLSAVTSWKGPGTSSRGNAIHVRALSGGVVDLSHVTDMSVGNTDFDAEDANSQINLAGLTSFTGAAPFSYTNYIIARQHGAITLTAGTIAVSNVRILVDPTATITAGTLQLDSGSRLTGSGTITANVINDATVSPGTATSTGLLTVSGDYTQTSTGALNIKLGGLAAGTEFDQFAVAGAAALDGTLNVTLFGGFTPVDGNTFQFLPFASSSGDFASKTGFSLGAGLFFREAQHATDFTLETFQAQLLFTQQPSDTVAGQSVSPAVQVAIVDPATNIPIAFDNTDIVTVAIGNNPGGGTLSGTLSRTVSGGVATFNNLSIDKTGAPYTLVASGASLSAVTSSGFAVTPAGADHLLFLQQPTDTAAGQTISTVIVEIVDAFGNVLTNDNSDTITLSIGTNPSGGTLSGTVTMTVTSGVATFTDLSIDLAGMGYTLHATVGGAVPDIDSNLFNIT
jgi:hypothetical protein